MGLDFIYKTAPTFKTRRSCRLQQLFDQTLFDTPGTARREVRAHWLTPTNAVAPNSPCLLRVENDCIVVYVEARRVGIVLQPPADVLDRIVDECHGEYYGCVQRASDIAETLYIEIE